ncbi:MAG: hypothetical protein M1368_12105 [Thaumarchaeota archaeon]|nr:hypothetical protein [Nitrososphaerota archaeon]
MLSGTRLRAKQRIPKTDVGSVHVDQVEQGDSVELPRWIAEVLINLDLCESQEESFSSEVFKAVNREKIAGQDQLAALRPDFYLKIRRHLAYANDASNLKPSAIPELDKTKTMIYDLIAMRLRKVLSIASSISPSIDIGDVMVWEEFQIFDTVYSLLQSWRAIAMEGK